MLRKFLGLMPNVGKPLSISFHIWAVRFQGATRARAVPTALKGAHACEKSSSLNFISNKVNPPPSKTKQQIMNN